MGKIYAVLSGKGGTGKSTVSIGLGLSYAQSGKRVLLIDLDEGLRCLDLMAGVSGQVVFDLADLLSGRPLEDATYPTALCENLFLIPAPQKSGSIDPEKLGKLLKEVETLYDVVILDFSAGLNQKLLPALPADTRCFAVCNPDPVSVRNAATMASHLNGFSYPAFLILNRFAYWNFRECGFKTLDDIIDSGGLRLLGVVPLDMDLAQLSTRHKLSKKSKALCAFDRMTARLEGQNVPLPKPKKI